MQSFRIPLENIATTPLGNLREEVEQKTSYALDKCELNVFETHRKAEKVKLTFDGFTITSMLRGKKVLHGEESVKDYLPGETFLIDATTEMVIDFPEANYFNPTQCTALVIDEDYLKKQVDYLNELNRPHEEWSSAWNLDLNNVWLRNDETIAQLSSRMLKLFAGNDPLKEILVDIKLKELMLCIMRLKNFNHLCEEKSRGRMVNERFIAVVEYIRRNLTSPIEPAELSKMACMSKSVFYRAFLNEFGVSPTKLILVERIRQAKSMLATENMKVKEICYALGFSDPNYFSRAFKKIEGITPLEYLAMLKK
jgi:AraC-like DNA-binding protein